ncbi:hypothetical protein A3D00_00035 [Candidatus Woesebacteria bacterium RIFCSPHIGHO2_02_FULL_38_9]|uniref:Uncharacterized protein n=1 Tax=Candidatus Woesebacteria bacterium RIFCSPHIGHO2_01_FULL_39_28 TaxID=1802496 RepID=A0A1F7YBF6_9BACT|nr:MAG: hypothetical protein A2627_02615 [Candidatus Woesebacteria bacterium RIFCSPHIGHO2_01_FULL_39_28]OGM33148.1 MAG: hypothetical protein A3D00_00035 [Candidatus Woesebacteria bacterium RIFCSPHIGHO2_02_FULL_38_9]OGM58395.1 MAG: hypothetical protein A3A50_02540 [Candidatus Woesebacteria bacterium RIFCSPLOWO2_01_FULL_38_20]
MSKRKKSFITSIILSLGFLGIQIFDVQFRFLSIGVLTLVTLILFAWSLSEGLGKDATLFVLILPTLFTLAVGLFWFLIPATIFARLPILIFYGLGVYSLCLTMNIFTVSSIRTIALSRAANGVGFVFTLLTSFLLYDTILSLRAEIWFNSLFVATLSFPLFLQGLWSSSLDKKFNSRIFIYSLIFGLGLSEVSILLYFWPTTVVVGSLFLTVGVYMLLGLGQAVLEGRLFAQTVKEYLFVAIAVFLAMFIATSWGG